MTFRQLSQRVDRKTNDLWMKFEEDFVHPAVYNVSTVVKRGFEKFLKARQQCDENKR